MDVVLGQNLGQIRPNVVKKEKKQISSISFFHILHREYLLKQEVVVVKNVTFEGRLGPNICLIWVKNSKKLIIFTLVSQS